MSCILGGINSVKQKFPHLVTSQRRPDSKIANNSYRRNYERNNSNLNATKSNTSSVKESSSSSKASSISRTGSSSSTIPAGGRSRPCSAEIKANSKFEILPDKENGCQVNNNR